MEFLVRRGFHSHLIYRCAQRCASVIRAQIRWCIPQPITKSMLSLCDSAQVNRIILGPTWKVS